MILISPSAASHLRTMLAERQSGAEGGGSAQWPAGENACHNNAGEDACHNNAGKSGLRIVVEKGGCAGMQYEMRFDVAGPEDIVNESEGGCVFVDPASARFLDGASLDYCDDLVGTGFRLHNPNAARSCGCGTSFEPFEPLEASESQERSGAVGEREATAAAHS